MIDEKPQVLGGAIGLASGQRLSVDCRRGFGGGGGPELYLGRAARCRGGVEWLGFGGTAHHTQRFG